MSTTTPEELLDFLRRVMAKEFEIEAAEVRPEAHLTGDLGLDSVDAMVMALRLEEETGLELSDDDLKGLETVASVVTLVHQRLAALSRFAS
jgi:acyl carrier protein